MELWKKRTKTVESKGGRATETQKGDYLCCVTHGIGLEMSFSSGTNLSVLSGVPRRLPTMLCCSVATLSVGVKFPHKTRARGRMAAYYSQPRPYVHFTKSDGQHNRTLLTHGRLPLLSLIIHPCLFVFIDDRAAKRLCADMHRQKGDGSGKAGDVTLCQDWLLLGKLSLEGQLYAPQLTYPSTRSRRNEE